jgi:hypothetical protein
VEADGVGERARIQVFILEFFLLAAHWKSHR